MAQGPSVDSAICYEVNLLLPCSLHELVQRLPAYSWAHVFSAAVGSAEPALSSSSVRARQALSSRIQRIDPLSAPRDAGPNYERAPHATLGIAFAANCLLGLFLMMKRHLINLGTFSDNTSYGFGGSYVSGRHF